MVQFFETQMGRRFFEGHVPKLLEEIAKLNENLAKIGTGSEYEATSALQLAQDLRVILFSDEFISLDSGTHLDAVVTLCKKHGFGPVK